MASKEIDTVVGVSINELIGVNLEGFCNLLEELVLADYEEDERYSYVLEDIQYEKVEMPFSDLVGVRVRANLIDISEE